MRRVKSNKDTKEVKGEVPPITWGGKVPSRWNIKFNGPYYMFKEQQDTIVGRGVSKGKKGGGNQVEQPPSNGSSNTL